MLKTLNRLNMGSLHREGHRQQLTVGQVIGAPKGTSKVLVRIGLAPTPISLPPHAS